MFFRVAQKLYMGNFSEKNCHKNCPIWSHWTYDCWKVLCNKECKKWESDERPSCPQRLPSFLIAKLKLDHEWKGVLVPNDDDNDNDAEREKAYWTDRQQRGVTHRERRETRTHWMKKHRSGTKTIVVSTLTIDAIVVGLGLVRFPGFLLNLLQSLVKQNKVY